MEKLCLKLKYRLALELIAARYHFAELLALFRADEGSGGKERNANSAPFRRLRLAIARTC